MSSDRIYGVCGCEQSAPTCQPERNQATDDCSASAVVKTPQQVRAYPKAAARKLPATGSKRTRKRKMAILMDTPVPKQLEIQSEGRKCCSTSENDFSAQA